MTAFDGLECVAARRSRRNARVWRPRMTSEAELQCRCGAVHGRVTNASPGTVDHMVCYCDDCQAYAHRLGRANLLDPHGGSDIVQVAPASLSFDLGADRLGGRVSPRGLCRWYATVATHPSATRSALGSPSWASWPRLSTQPGGAPRFLLGKGF